MSELAGQVSIVTGAAQGIGLGIARSLAAAGAAVMLVDINAEKASAAAAALAEQGYRIASAGADVGAQADVAAMVEKTLDSFGRIDVLVSNAGGSGHVALPTIEETDEAAWDAVVSSNLRGTYLCARAVVPHMKEQKVAGRIINFSSVVTSAHACPMLHPRRESRRSAGSWRTISIPSRSPSTALCPA
jgi:NAD(P)-dependent dehydrogenase (short-subunit alcohol dehydrogenase family)